MASRHQSRTIALQSLYEMDFRGIDPNLFEEVLTHNVQKFSQDDVDLTYAKSLLDGILKKKSEIDAIIVKAAPEWPLDKIGTVDRNVLRLGLYELIYADKKEVPAKVAINEAIEVAKFFSGETSGKFVNGVLGAVYRELYGADEANKKSERSQRDKAEKKPRKELTAEEKAALPVQKLVGSIVYANHEGDTYLALVHDVFGFWTLSKGKIQDDEELVDAAKRKVTEELGIDCSYKQTIDTSEYVASHPEFKKIRKQVEYRIAETTFTPLTAKKEGGLKDAAWFKIDDVLALNLYEDMIPVITKAIDAIRAL
jgi:transcription antitermination protein NusB